MSEIKGKIKQLAVSKQGSKRLQTYFSTLHNSPELVSQILEEIHSDLTFMMMDNYSNYSLKSLFQVCSQPQRQSIINKIAPEIHKISKNKKGTHCLQNLVSLIDSDEEEQRIIEDIENHLLVISKVTLTPAFIFIFL